MSKWLVPILMALVFLSLFILVPARAGSCSNGQCGPVGPIAPPVFVHVPQYQWVSFKDTPDQIALVDGAYQVGGYSFVDKIYRRLLPGDVWGNPETPPVTPPEVLRVKYEESKKCKCTGKEDCKCGPGCKCEKCKEHKQVSFGEPPTGVVTEKIEHGVTEVNGVVCPPGAAFDVLGANLPDDSGKCFITIIDSDNIRRAAIRKEIDSNPDSQKFLVQDVNPLTPIEAWMVSCGFRKPDSGTVIYAQAPNGKVIWRADNYDKEKIRVALRKTDPNYDPAKDPDLNPHAPPSPEPGPVPPEPTPDGKFTAIHYCCFGLAGALALMYLKKKEGK